MPALPREITPVGGFCAMAAGGVALGFWVPYSWLLTCVLAVAVGVWGSALVFAFITLRSPAYRPANWLRMALGVSGFSCSTGLPVCWVLWALMMTAAGVAGLACELTGQLPDPRGPRRDMRRRLGFSEPS